VKWYRKAAEQNYAVAQNNLGVCYQQGKGVAKDQMKADLFGFATKIRSRR
jgi:TPR repeat protein